MQVVLKILPLVSLVLPVLSILYHDLLPALQQPPAWLLEGWNQTQAHSKEPQHTGVAPGKGVCVLGRLTKTGCFLGRSLASCATSHASEALSTPAF